MSVIIKFLSSLKLAIVILVLLAIFSAFGTFVEAKYDSAIAQKLVYQSNYMIALLLILVINLTAVIISRYPWKKNHIGFILSHSGIILLLIGSFITQKIGIDGSMAIEIGEKSNQVLLNNTTDFIIYGSFNKSHFVKIFEKEVDFYTDNPQKKSFNVSLPSGDLKVIDYIPFAITEEKIVSNNDNDALAGAALRFQLQHQSVDTNQWLLVEKSGEKNTTEAQMNLGPIQIILTESKSYQPNQKNVIVFEQNIKNNESLYYKVYTKNLKTPVKTGTATIGSIVNTPWMGIKLRILKYFAKAQRKITFSKQDYPSSNTTQAIKVKFQNREEWIPLNGMTKFFVKEGVFVASYANRKLNLDFDIKLNKFNMDRYPGSEQAMSYESEVTLEGLSNTVISMNQPLTYQGFTFYQSSFQNDETGKPILSVFSVNRDPGRFFKYFGSCLIVFGSILLFYFRKLNSSLSATKSKEG